MDARFHVRRGDPAGAPRRASFLSVFVLDASVAAAWLLDEPAASRADLAVALTLAGRHRLSFYDAIYLELAKRRAAPVATLDKALARAAAGEGLPLVCDRR